MIVLLNTSILTAHGTFTYVPCSLEIARTMWVNSIAAGCAVSYVGHQATVDVLHTLGFACVANRAQFTQTEDDIAIVFKLRGRPAEGKILTAEEIEAIGYDFGLLAME